MLPATAILRRLPVAPSYLSCKLLPRTIHGGCILRQQRNPPNPVSHSAENYFVDGDDTPPPNDTIYKVDAASDAAQSAYEPPSGPWSRVGAGTEEYRTVSKEAPYDVPNGPDVNLRYGGRRGYMEERGLETSKAGEGPEGTDRWGRRPEGQRQP